MPVVNPAYIDKLLALVNTSAFPSHLPFELVSIAEDRAVIALNADARHRQPFGIVHGGVLATLIDTATFWAAFLPLPEDAGLVNIDLKLNYLRSTRGGRLTAEGRCIRAGRTISYAEAYVYDADGNLLTHGTSTLMTLPGKGIDVGVAKFIDG